jgi:GNAT superfamily N-acetyltransferase
MKLIIVGREKKYIQAFLQLPVRLYKNEKNWIRPLDKDIEEVFDEQKNKTFKFGSCIRWVLQDDNGQTIGRVAAFINKRTLQDKHMKIKVGGMGFFECINDEEAAFKLFDACKKWLIEQGVEAMDGPINFGERDRWWGLHISGNAEPNYRMGYHHAYYKDLFEKYGFQLYFRQYTYTRDTTTPPSAEIKAKYERVMANKEYELRTIDKNQLKKFASDFAAIYNQAWVKIGTPKLADAQAYLFMKQMKPIMDEDIVIFAYHNKKPVGFFVMMPELNQLIKHLNGKFGLWQKIKLFFMLKTGKCRKIFGVAFGVIPEYQGRGIDGAMAQYGYILQCKIKRYDTFEMNWIGDFNPKMMHVAESIGGTILKVHATYRFLFDNTIPFERCPMI